LLSERSSSIELILSLLESHSNLMGNRLDSLLRNEQSSSESALLAMTACPDSVKHKNSDGDLPIHVECSKLCRYDVMLKAIELYPESLLICDKAGRFSLLILLQNRRASVSTVRMVIEKYMDRFKSNALSDNMAQISDLLAKEEYLCSNVQRYLSASVEICPESVVTALCLGYLRLRDFLNVPSLLENTLLEIVERYPNILKIHDSFDGNLIHIECVDKCRFDVLSTFISLSPESLSMVNGQGDPPLHMLLRKRPGKRFVILSLATMMIVAYPEALTQKSKSNNLPIHIECLNSCRHELLVDMITSHPETLLDPNSNGSLPLHSLLMNPYSSIESAELLLMVSPQAARGKTRRSSYPIHVECSQQCRWEVISQLIELWPEALHEANQDGLLPLHLLLENRSSTITSVQLLLDSFPGAASYKDRADNYPLHVECNQLYRVEAIARLVELYPNALSETNQDGCLPLHLVLKKPSSNTSIFPTVMLINAFPGAASCRDEEDNYPIHLECSHQCRGEIVHQLIELYPDAFLRANREGRLPLHLLLKSPSCSILLVQQLLNLLPDAATDKDRADNYPLHVECSQQCRIEVVRQLIELYPDALSIPNLDGYLPFNLLQRNQSTTCIKAILHVLAIDKCRSALHRKDKDGHLPIAYEINHDFRLEVISKFIELHPPYLDILLAQETASWPRVLAYLNTSSFLAFYPILFKWLAAYPARLPSLLCRVSLIKDAFCLRLTLNKYPSARNDLMLIQKYRDYNWQARSGLVLLLAMIKSNHTYILSARSTSPSANKVALSESTSLNQSQASAGWAILSILIRISTSLVVSNNNSDHTPPQVCSGDEIGDCLLRLVARFL
jgi:ankyrin repeat protein